jgi:hypothetical protein
MNLKLKSILSLTLFFSILSLMGCGGSGGTGTLSLGLTDAPGDEFSAVYVTIDEIQVHAKGDAPDTDPGWQVVANPNRTYNLIELSNGLVEGLGEGPLEAGSYTQLRLIVGNTPDGSPNIQCHPHPFANYAIDADDGEIHELKVPSGEQTGIKIICQGLCDIAENQTTELILDFDAAASITPSFNLKPTIKVLTTDDFTIVQGMVRNSTDSNNPLAIPDARVSAQVFDSGAADLADVVTVRTSTESDLDGNYELFVRPGEYNLVAFQEGFGPVAVNFSALAGQVAIQDFGLVASDMSQIGGSVNIAAVTEPTFAHLSFRRDDVLLGETVEVTDADVLSGAGYSVNLPVGDYQVVSSTCGLPTQSADVALTAGSDVLLDIVF